MYALYENTAKEFECHKRVLSHIPPHVSGAVECIYVAKGCMELGIRQELYHMAAGDFAIVFPQVIHHQQVFTAGENEGIYFLADPVIAGSLLNTLRTKWPANPIIPHDHLHPDIINIMERIASDKTDVFDERALYSGYLMVLLSRALPEYTLEDRDSYKEGDLIYQAVSYIAEHFTEPLSLTGVADALYVSKYALSRIFSATFHTNFNQYVNDMRLKYAVYLLTYTDNPVTEICYTAGFESQRTFNRVFKDVYHIAPRAYRDMLKNSVV